MNQDPDTAGGAVHCATEEDRDFDRHLESMVAASERTRGILYFLALVFCSTSIVFLEYTFFDWPTLRFNKMHLAYTCYVQDSRASNPLQDSKADSPLQDSKASSLTVSPSDACLEAYKYVKTYYKIPLYDLQTKQLNIRLGTLLDERYKQTIKSYFENITTTIPLVGTRYDKNSVILFHNIIMICILGILFLSLKNEQRCLSYISRFANNPQKRALILNSHIFSGSKSGVTIWYFLFAPGAVGLIQFFKDNLSFPVKLESSTFFGFYTEILGSSYGWLYPVVELGLTIALNVLAWRCFTVASSFDEELSKFSESSNATSETVTP